MRELLNGAYPAIFVAKGRRPELVAGVETREEEIVVTRKGKPAAVWSTTPSTIG